MTDRTFLAVGAVYYTNNPLVEVEVSLQQPQSILAGAITSGSVSFYSGNVLINTLVLNPLTENANGMYKVLYSNYPRTLSLKDMVVKATVTTSDLGDFEGEASPIEMQTEDIEDITVDKYMGGGVGGRTFEDNLADEFGPLG